MTLLVVLALARCSATEDTDEPATSTGTTTGPTGPTEPAVPTVAPTPTVAPATGPMITGPIASLNVPAGFNPKGTQRSRAATSAAPTPATTSCSPTARPRSPTSPSTTWRNNPGESSFNDPPLKRQPDVTIAGQPAYHLAGKDTSFPTWAEEFGFRYQGHTIDISNSTPRGLPQAERDALNAAVLASVTLRR